MAVRSTDPMPAHAEGRCACGRLSYRLTAPPFSVHACHCSHCQRETGGAFAVNALIESDQVDLVQGKTETIDTPSESGRGQKIVRCANCHCAVWSHYPAFGNRVMFVRAGTLEDPQQFPPDVHIYTDSKASWLSLPKDVPAYPELYQLDEVNSIFGEGGGARWWKALRGE